MKLFPQRYRLLKYFVLTFLVLSTLLRFVFLFWNFSEVDKSFFKMGNTLTYGFLFDLGTVSFFAIPYALYLLLLPKRFYGSLLDKIVTYFGYTLGLIIFLFSFFAEITFWEEFKRRFNFIAVDYLIYTYEVVKNINESYPIPLLVGGILMLTAILLFITKRKGIFTQTFIANTSFKQKIFPTLFFIIVAVASVTMMSNKTAEFSQNRYNNELAKTGIYSFFAAFRNNELSYTEFYATIDEEEAFEIQKKAFQQAGDSLFNPNEKSIYRLVKNNDTLPEKYPNVIFICVESLSAKFLGSFGNKQNITPVLDSLAKENILFTNLFATGTRTVRGMEAITLSIPPTPGRSIVKRKNNTGLFTIGDVFTQKGYERNFFYGGDGYFDNMNTFFGGNGFNIIDRGRGFLIDSAIKTKRTNIEDQEVTFENAWGVCDEDIYNKVLQQADIAYANNKRFFDFVMTTSNHRPYTYPENKIDIPSGTGRNGAVKYTDYAIGQLLKKAQTKPWYKNTVFVIMADHCASSAGRQALDVKNYRIPTIIVNAPLPSQKIKKMTSQIDLFPTLFGMFNWNYNSNLYGVNILQNEVNGNRALIGNYRKLGLLKTDSLLVLSNRKRVDFFKWNKQTNELLPLHQEESFYKNTVSYYQTADYLFGTGGLKLSNLEKQ